MNIVDNQNPVLPEWTTAIYDSIQILMKRGYLHSPNDVEFVRPGYKPISPCGQGGSDGPIDLNQLKWAAEKGDFWFLWYPGSYLKLGVHKGTMRHDLKLDPTKENVWEFVRKVDSDYK